MCDFLIPSASFLLGNISRSHDSMMEGTLPAVESLSNGATDRPGLFKGYHGKVWTNI